MAGLLEQQPGCHVVSPQNAQGMREAVLAARRQPLVSRRLDGFTRRSLTARLANVFTEARV
jgi:hypothetical protein